MSKGILTVTVNPAVDVTVISPPSGPGGRSRLRMRCSTNSSGLVLSAGGKGVNVARALRNLGAPVLAAGIAGGETGNFLQRSLRKENIPVVFLGVQGPTRLNVTVLGSRLGGGTRVIQEGPRLTPKEIRHFEIEYRRWLRRSRWVVLCGRNAVGAPVDWYARLIHLARKEGVPAAVDTSGAALAAALKARPFLIKPNLEEAEAVVHRRLNSLARIKEALRHFHSRGVRVVLLSLGARGAVASDGKDFWRARPPRVRVVNDVGCGDALLAGFLSAFEKRSLAEALRRGVACGTANALGSTPGAIHLNGVSRFERRVTVDRGGTRGQ